MSELADRFLTVADLIVYSTLSRDMLERAMRDPVDPLPSHQVGTRILVRRSEFDAWIDRRRRSGVAGPAPRVRRQLARLNEPVRIRPRLADRVNNTPSASA